MCLLIMFLKGPQNILVYLEQIMAGSQGSNPMVSEGTDLTDLPCLL